MLAQTARVFITVMTYPQPSRSYRELVCTAGITDAYEWVRLYPIDYRYQPRERQFHKYQWVEVDLLPRGAGNDGRKESRKPVMESLKILGPPLDTRRDREWRARREIIDKMPIHTVRQLEDLYERERVSLGVVRPSRVLDVKIEKTGREWTSTKQVLFRQFSLFGDVQKPLVKIPFKFSYVFECEDSTSPHERMIEDWELGVLYLNEVARMGDEREAAESVRYTYLHRLCSPDRDTRFFMGTTYPWNSWVVVGVFYPPKSPLDKQPSLFDRQDCN
ncbi:MAG: hypothetical protein GX863_02035 [Firmicutes bacterium]|jgi:hypothetical protein|nr:hypothetical protein [Candidatus Fermentithermobacillaceae bacterium]